MMTTTMPKRLHRPLSLLKKHDLTRAFISFETELPWFKLAQAVSCLNLLFREGTPSKKTATQLSQASPLS